MCSLFKLLAIPSINIPLVFQDWVDGVFAFHPASMQCSFSKSTWDKPHLRPLALCVSLEVEAEGRIGVQEV